MTKYIIALILIVLLGLYALQKQKDGSFNFIQSKEVPNDSIPNDYFLNKCENPQYGPSDFWLVGLRTSNTELLSREYYRGKEYTQRRFKMNGKFDIETYERFFDALEREWYRFKGISENKNFNYDRYIEAENRVEKIIGGCTFWEPY